MQNNSVMVYRTDSELIFFSLKWFRITHTSIHQNNKGLHPCFYQFQARDSFYSTCYVFHELGTVNINFYTQLNRSVIYYFGLIFLVFLYRKRWISLVLVLSTKFALLKLFSAYSMWISNKVLWIKLCQSFITCITCFLECFFVCLFFNFVIPHGKFRNCRF